MSERPRSRHFYVCASFIDHRVDNAPALAVLVSPNIVLWDTLKTVLYNPHFTCSVVPLVRYRMLDILRVAIWLLLVTVS